MRFKAGFGSEGRDGKEAGREGEKEVRRKKTYKSLLNLLKCVLGNEEDGDRDRDGGDIFGSGMDIRTSLRSVI